MAENAQKLEIMSEWSFSPVVVVLRIVRIVGVKGWRGGPNSTDE